ncbi:MAG: STAS domain-containing protein [Pseudomonadota bacterium]
MSSSPAKRWEIDLTELEFMDSAALSMLLIARDQAHTRGVEIVLTNPRGRVRQLFDLADIPAMMAIEERERP